MRIDLLVVGAHPDDAELGAGGLLSLAKRAGLRTGVLVLTRGEGGTTGDAKQRSAEAGKAAAILGLDEFRMLQLPDTRVELCPEYIEEMEAVLLDFAPATIVSHSESDWNPDHAAAWKLVERSWALANRYGRHGDKMVPRPSLLQFPIDLRRAARPDLVVDISAVWEKKQQALLAHASQSAVTEFAASAASYCGRLIGVDYGEPFYLPEPLGIGEDLRILRRREDD